MYLFIKTENYKNIILIIYVITININKKLIEFI